MPKRTDLKRIMIIGAGPIVIGQACEFDYSGSQACRALKEEGYEVILLNSNPATIMTDPDMADKNYIEPITPAIVEKIVKKERPDAILPTMGGQTALNAVYELYREGTLEQYNVALIGANYQAIHTAEDREVFKTLVEKIGLGVLRSKTASTVQEAVEIAKTLGYPLIIRAGFTLGGSGGSVVQSEAELKELARHGLEASPVSQVLLEESALGWKEYEFEVMRDGHDNVVIVCSVENVDPMGVHTGDSITVAPAQTLSDKEYHTLRNASIEIIREVGVEAGGCNIQFAVHPKTGRVVVIEMNPRVSRSSALVSKATGVPIAKVSAKLAIGMTLDEITNDITKSTPASFEPAIDYVVTKIPRFAFEKFPGEQTHLSPQMKSVGEVMAIGRTFQESFQKAMRSLEIGLDGFVFPLEKLEPDELRQRLQQPQERLIRWIYHALHSNLSVSEIYELTGVDPWFLENFLEIVDTEKKLWHTPIGNLSKALLVRAKRQGFSNAQILKRLAPGPGVVEQLNTMLSDLKIKPVFSAVDTCAGEFRAQTPYYYSTHHGTVNEVQPPSGKKRVVIIGGGPNRIGQGIEFDYCCVHAAFALQELGYEAIMLNSNPETVSTDYDISDRLYFEPLTAENVLNILSQEQPDGVIVQLGGQTPLKLSHPVNNAGYPILGTTVDSIDLAEDRDKFGQILQKLQLKAPPSGTARTVEEALSLARRIGYPLIARPSYVLGGRAMQIFYSEQRLIQYLSEVVQVEPDYPVLIEHFLEEAKEVDVDAVSDGEETHVGAILEHVEHAGVHSGDSTCVWPPQNLQARMIDEITLATGKLAKELGVKGLLNIQFAVKQDELYVIEVNPRASRTVPYVCKATGIPLIKIATRLMLGERLADLKPMLSGPQVHHVAVKVPVFPFNKFKGTDPKLGPEMKSTGEVMGIAPTFGRAFAKAQIAAGNKIPTSGQIFISVNDMDKPRAINIARQYVALGFNLIATQGTAETLQAAGLAVSVINKKRQGPPHAEALIQQGEVSLIINTPIGEEALQDDSYIRKTAIAYQIPMITTMSGAEAMLEAIASLITDDFEVKSLQEHLEPRTHQQISI